MDRIAIIGRVAKAARVMGGLAIVLACGAAEAGIPLVSPPDGARVVNFDNVENAPTSFSSAIAVRESYEAVGIDFSASGNDGGAVLASNGSSGISGISPPNALFFNSAATLQGGGNPKLPQDLLFRLPVRYVQLNVGDVSGTTITAEAFNADSESVDVVNVVPTSAMQTIVLEGRHIVKVEITGGGSAQVIDDIAFVLDTTVVNFDEKPVPPSFAAATALRREYVGTGFESVSSTNSNTVDGGAVLNETSGIPVTGFSPPNFFAIDGSATMASGGTAKLPVYLQFFPPIRYARFLVADPDGGSTVTAKGSYFGGPPVYQAQVQATAAMAPIEITGDPMTFLEITSTGSKLVLDDLEFLVAGTKIDFDDYTNVPTLLGETTAIRDRYKALGVRFKGPGNDGPALVGFLNPFGAITGLSGTNFLGFDAAELLGNGASANLPMTVEFDRPVKRVDLFVASNQGTRIFVNATDALGGLNASTDVITTTDMQVMFLYYDGIKKLEITAQGNAGVIDNLTFEPTDPCPFDLCYQGETLNPYCSDCATTICAENSDCCNDGWDESCAVLAEANCNLSCGPLCGDANADRKISAPDALSALKTAVGTASCPGYRCNFNGTGGVTSGDALLILRTSVGQPTDPNCPPEAM